ncbi:N-acetylglucosaminidase [[Ruminococcus] torques]|uniref:N-acetylglucosaminidase n=1 Tax=[Ruminococcus] torques TaxID=33039 RepID=UPI0025A3F3A6|nr:glucosaminidase domain-containing protein [[Ruminococcus] torques]MDM8237301.1 glucosaminidase domain-containing protein [[Ruminococcus] torques]
MIKRNKLLICTLVMSMALTLMPGVTSRAAEAEGETEASVSEIQDENIQRLEEVTAMDEDGSIREIEDVNGTVDEADGTDGIALFSVRSFSPKVVNFNTKGNAVTNYTDETNGISGYTNGAYGADAAYLGTTSDGKIRFMLSGVTGTVSASEVELVDYSAVADNVSYYTVSSGRLLHYISQNLETAPASAINNGTAPSYLNEGGKYYSYDGHYFYTDYSVMLTDYQQGTNGASAVNAGNPFNNYFQFLDMNLSTSYTGDELDSMLSAAMTNAGVDPASSKLTGTGNSFVKYQNTYSVNALLSLGIAINESAWGRSNICLTKNNIFGLNAVDSSPGDAYAFSSIDDCIREFMNYQMANAYLKDGQWSNHGEYLGNKGGGINVSYASDPYWGEKAAAHAWNLDTLGGGKDYQGTDNTTPDDTVTTPPETDSTTPDDTVTTPPETDGTTPDDTVTTPPETDSTTPDDTVTAPPETETETTPSEDEGGTTPEDNTDNAAGITSDGDGTSENKTEQDTVTEKPSSQSAPAAKSADVQITAATDTTARSPKTGDAADASLWIVLAGISGMFVIAALSMKEARKRVK